ncbi:hypothetical protein CSOJ01_04942 [Colletotrichum sojae]|uniref:Uncharacterized protein n=1 Tax=Colletotrichum sojae TaxID=2175907 RepID=A0A8H6JHJ4_9PEZI|nr:hypothetical protein CSOJ01_04942 [Colletotrichum sojae]
MLGRGMMIEITHLHFSRLSPLSILVKRSGDWRAWEIGDDGMSLRAEAIEEEMGPKHILALLRFTILFCFGTSKSRRVSTTV